MMHYTIELPDKYAVHLQKHWSDVERHLLERLVLEAYAEDVLTTPEVQEILQLPDRFAVYELCDKYKIATYSLADLQRDRETTQRLGF